MHRCVENEMRRNRLTALAVVVAMLFASALGASCAADHGIAMLNFNTMHTVTNFSFTEEGRACVHVDYTGYRDTTGADITIRLERRNFLFFWEEVVFSEYAVRGSTYHREFYYQISKEGLYRCTVVYTVHGLGEDDVITFEDVRIYDAEQFEKTQTDGSETVTVTDTRNDPVPTVPEESEGLLLYDSEYGWSELAHTGSWRGDVLVIPAHDRGKPVTHILASALDDCDPTQIVLPSTLRYVHRIALEGMTALQYNAYGGALYLGTADNPYFALIRAENEDIVSCELHRDTRIVAAGAFSDCRNLRTVILSDGLLNIGEEAFFNCGALIYYDYLGGLYLGTRNNPYFAFVKWNGTEEMACVLHPDTVRVESGAFAEKTVREVTLNEGLRVLAYRAFTGAKGDFSLSVPSGVQMEYQSLSGAQIGHLHIKEGAVLTPGVAEYGAIKRFSAEEGLERVPFSAFYSNPSLTSVQLPDSVLYIEDRAFMTTGLESISLPRHLKSIGASAFAECNDLGVLMLPQSLHRIGEGAFSGCRLLHSITVPGGVEELGARAFSGCRLLRRAVIEAPLSRLPSNLFQGCISLTDVILPETLRVIGSYAFMDCSSLETIRIPDGVFELELMIFQDCSALREVTLPRALSRMDRIFLNCRSLERVYYHGSAEAFDKIAKPSDFSAEDLTSVLMYLP